MIIDCWSTNLGLFHFNWGICGSITVYNQAYRIQVDTMDVMAILHIRMSFQVVCMCVCMCLFFVFITTNYIQISMFFFEISPRSTMHNTSKVSTHKSEHAWRTVQNKLWNVCVCANELMSLTYPSYRAPFLFINVKFELTTIKTLLASIYYCANHLMQKQ